MRRRFFQSAATLGSVAAIAMMTQVGVGGARQLTVPHLLPRTTAPDSYVNVHVTMTNSKFIFARHAGPRGSDARFIIKNTSDMPHNLEFGARRKGLALQNGFSATVQPHQQKILLLYLDHRGKIDYYGGLQADRNKPGMQGTFDIGSGG